jgi:SAM-dependent methyltransferase
MFKKFVEKLMVKIKIPATRLRYLPFDIVDSIFKKSDELMPPRWMNFAGGGDFKKTGAEFFNYFIELGKIQPSFKILEIGSGIGRMAIPLTKYLNSNGSYYGLDIVKQGIKWCDRNITPRYQNFHFEIANIYNKIYNPEGEIKGSEYILPFDEESFDFIFLTSVFTHMVPEEVENYIAEISRVLKKDNLALITFFLLNKESRYLIDKGLSAIDFKFDHDFFKLQYEEFPEAAIAYDETYIYELFKKNGLEVLEPIRYGSFSGRADYLSYQDIIIVKKL